jgi:hypothetical protein
MFGRSVIVEKIYSAEDATTAGCTSAGSEPGDIGQAHRAEIAHTARQTHVSAGGENCDSDKQQISAETHFWLRR